MFGAYPPPPPDFASEVTPLPEMEPFETVDFTTESFPLDQVFPEDNLAALEITEPPLLPPPAARGRGRGRGRAGGRLGGRNELRRVGRDGGSVGGRNAGRVVERIAGRDAGRVAGGEGRGAGGGGRGAGRGAGARGAGAARGQSKSPGSAVESVVETPPARGSADKPSRGGGASTREASKSRQDILDTAEYWETGESGTGFGLETEETEENFVNVDAKGTAPAAGAAGSGNGTNSTSSTSSKTTDLTESFTTASNFTSSVQSTTESDLPFFDETGPSAEIGMEAAGYMESTLSGGGGASQTF